MQLHIIKDGQKGDVLNLSNARRKTYAQLQQMTDLQKKGVIVCEDYPIPEDSDSVSVTADGVKTIGQLLNELYALVDKTKLSGLSCYKVRDVSAVYEGTVSAINNNSVQFSFDVLASNNRSQTYRIAMSSSSQYAVLTTDSNGTSTFSDLTSYTMTSGAVLSVIYNYYKNLDIHTEYLAENCMMESGDNVEDVLGAVKGQVANSSDAYSASKAYSVDDYCIYNDTLYRCVTACTAASWSVNSSCFVKDTVVGAISGLTKQLIIENVEFVFNNSNYAKVNVSDITSQVSSSDIKAFILMPRGMMGWGGMNSAKTSIYLQNLETYTGTVYANILIFY